MGSLGRAAIAAFWHCKRLWKKGEKYGLPGNTRLCTAFFHHLNPELLAEAAHSPPAPSGPRAVVWLPRSGPRPAAPAFRRRQRHLVSGGPGAAPTRLATPTPYTPAPQPGVNSHPPPATEAPPGAPTPTCADSPEALAGPAHPGGCERWEGTPPVPATPPRPTHPLPLVPSQAVPSPGKPSASRQTQPTRSPASPRASSPVRPGHGCLTPHPVSPTPPPAVAVTLW